MRTILSTAGMPSREALDYWHDVACTRITKHELQPHDRHGFYAYIKTGMLGDLPC